MTVLEVLQSTTAYFQKRSIESPRLNAEHLVAHSLGKKRIELYLEFERALSEPELAPLRELVRRRGLGEPLQHLVGTVEFANHTFVTDRRALIPRPETEQLVEYLCDLTWPEAPRMLDVGTGSGVIVLSLAARFPTAELHAVDISPDALTLARDAADPADAAIDRERRQALWAALHTLPASQRMVLTCRYLLDLDEAETAAVLGIARGTVKSRSYHALRRLREAVG